MATTSARPGTASVTACATVSASAPSATQSSPSSIERSPRRTTGWSSTMRIRWFCTMLLVRLHPLAAGAMRRRPLLTGSAHRQPDLPPRPAAVRARDLARPADLGGPLLHRAQPHPASHLVAEADAVV